MIGHFTCFAVENVGRSGSGLVQSRHIRPGAATVGHDYIYDFRLVLSAVSPERPPKLSGVRLSICPSVRLSVCPSVRLSVRLSVCPSVRPSVRLSV